MAINMKITSFLVYCCHDSAIGFLLLSLAARSHFSAALKSISDKMANSKKVDKAGDVFSSVIEEENESDEEAHALDLTNLIEEEKFLNNMDLVTLDKDISDTTAKIKMEYDIIGRNKNRKFYIVICFSDSRRSCQLD